MPHNATLVVIDHQPSQVRYEVHPVVDAIAGTSAEAHRAGLERVVQAGRQPVSWVSLACELQRDWAREATVADVVELVLTERLART
jgi:hypothetical protein